MFQDRSTRTCNAKLNRIVSWASHATKILLSEGWIAAWGCSFPLLEPSIHPSIHPHTLHDPKIRCTYKLQASPSAFPAPPLYCNIHGVPPSFVISINDQSVTNCLPEQSSDTIRSNKYCHPSEWWPRDFSSTGIIFYSVCYVVLCSLLGTEVE